MTTLVVGRGLLGRSVVAALAARGERVDTVEVPWGRTADSVRVLLGAAERAASSNSEWRLVWTAGAGVIASSSANLDEEVACFRAFADGMSSPPAAMFLASSAGGAYGGSPDSAPFTEGSAVHATSSYGLAKLSMEQGAVAISRRGSNVVLGRIANLFGPGQNLSKAQGLVSRLCLAHLTRQPLKVYTSMDTLRDYVFVGDAARKVMYCLDLAADGGQGRVTVKILASGQARSVGSLVGEATRAFRRRPHLIIRSEHGQVRDLRLRSTVWTEVDTMVETPFAVGLRATLDDINRQVCAGALAGRGVA